VRVLLDESLPRQLARELAGHDVRTAVEQGWKAGGAKPRPYGRAPVKKSWGQHTSEQACMLRRWLRHES